MKRVGILTYWWSNENYGQLLQLYATYTILKSMGLSPYVIQYSYIGDQSLKKSFLKRIFGVILNPRKILFHIKCQLNPSSDYVEVNKQREFDDFRQRHFRWTRLYKTFADLKTDSPEMDAYIVGSDMVWVSPFEPYFLKFGSSAIKRIAYAPSFGSGTISSGYIKKLPYLLQDFDYLSVRERSGKELIKAFSDKEIKWLPDPTLLLSQDAVRELSKKTIKHPSNYMFVYFLGNNLAMQMKDIYEFAKSQDLSIKYTTAHERKDNYAKIYPTIEEWINLIDQSEYILTNSFHGIVFSILLNKQFLFVPNTYNKGKTNERIHSLLNRLNLSNRIWNGNIDFIKIPIDYYRVNHAISIWRNEGLNYLHGALL